jgi:cytoskeletal protein CcmA (bactofilin family)
VFKRRKPEEPPVSETLAQPLSGPSPIGSPGAGRAPDNGIGVPPRPALSKEPQAMSRPPYPAGPAAPQPVQPARQGMQQGRQPAERRTLVVGRGITVNGTIQDAERLVVEGVVEASSINAAELMVALGGLFRGEAVVEEAEIAGTVDGTLTARATLVVRGSGRVIGTARCRRLQVEDGGQISGQIEMITDAAPASSEPVA